MRIVLTGITEFDEKLLRAYNDSHHTFLPFK